MPHLNVLDNAVFGMELASFAKPERTEKALAALQQVNLEQ